MKMRGIPGRLILLAWIGLSTAFVMAKEPEQGVHAEAIVAAAELGTELSSCGRIGLETSFSFGETSSKSTLCLEQVLWENPNGSRRPMKDRASCSMLC